MFSPGLVRENVFDDVTYVLTPVWAAISAALGIKYGHDFNQYASKYNGLQQMWSFKVSPLPVTECKQQQSKQVANQEKEVKVPVQEEPLWQEAPVYGPLKQKLAAEIKRLTHVTKGIL